MKFKLDENLGLRGARLLREAGHDVATVREEGLGGAEDEAVFRACQEEGRALITLDHDFGNVLRFPPETGHGVVVLELPEPAHPDAITLRLREFLGMLAQQPLQGGLWIVEPGRVRIHQRSPEAD